MSYQPLDNDEPTIVKPTPGGRKRPGATVALPQQQAPGETPALDLAAFASASVNPVLAAAAPILNLTRRLRGSAAQRDPETLRSRMTDEVKAFERRMLAQGVPPEQARAAHYAICAMLDDIVLNTPWGAYSAWARQGMVSTFHMDVTGGERFFDLLTHMHKDPGANRDVLTLMYVCLSLGFEGRLRVIPEGALELSRVREGLYRTLRAGYGDFERELSPHWRGIEARHRPLRAAAVLWTITSLAAATLVAAFFAFTYNLNRESDLVLQRVAQAPPNGPVAIQVAKPAPPPVPDTVEALRSALAPVLAENVASLLRDPPYTVIRVHNAGMFASGSATLEDRFVPLLNQIAQAIAQQPGKVIVTGHTDNVPVHSIRLPSNWALSQERAKAVGEILAKTVPASRMSWEGRGETQPVASNDTAAGRDANRRTDILVADTQSAVASPADPAR